MPRYAALEMLRSAPQLSRRATISNRRADRASRLRIERPQSKSCKAWRSRTLTMIYEIAHRFRHAACFTVLPQEPTTHHQDSR
jgi:hypothetical protein